MANTGDKTLDLLARARAGDRASVDMLFQRCLPSLRRWARGRLPACVRGLSDTQDLVQETILRALTKLSTFQPQHQGALQAYLRNALTNRICDEVRRVQRRPAALELNDEHTAATPPLEQAIGSEGVQRYEAALQRLKPADREAIVARIELQQSYEEVAAALGKQSASAARMAVTRALARLIEQMDYER
jgi:RNA polymerase sigma-70 factor, ECF subfamily